VKTRRQFVRCLGSAGLAFQPGVLTGAPLAGCRENLRAIHEAVCAYRQRYRVLPLNLTALAQDGLIDRRLLICPVHASAGTNRIRRLELVNGLAADPWTLYKWEWLPGSQTELHERQRLMGAGDWVPLVRCDQHGDGNGNDHLNLSLGGGIYPSGVDWEFRLRHLVPYPYLSAKSLIWQDHLVPLRQRIPGRSPEATTRQIDFGRVFNGALSDPWTEGYPGDEAPELLEMGPENGMLSHGGFRFELRGVVQLEGSKAVEFHRKAEPTRLQEARFPQRMTVLKVSLETAELHLLIGVILEQPVGTAAGIMMLTMEDGGTLRLVLRHGMQVAHAVFLSSPEATLVWQREQGRRSVYAPRSVSHVVWPLGGVRRIVSITFEATDSASSPFLLALTAA
jgi:hypothetical protein